MLFRKILTTMPYLQANYYSDKSLFLQHHYCSYCTNMFSFFGDNV